MWKCALIILAALAIASPIILAPPLVHDSFWIDYVWTSRFTESLLAGNIFPRWLDNSFGGLGAPVFYFYAPLPFYIAGFFDVLGLNSDRAVIAAFTVGLAISGLSMFAWLAKFKHPLLGAILYMALPYHLLDFARRGAIGEFFAMAFLPLIALGIRRAADDRGFGLLAVAYAGIIFCHLPTALLATMFLALPYAIFCCRKQMSGIKPVAIGLNLGLGISAIYLIPALFLQPATNMASMWREGFQPTEWNILTPGTWPTPSTMGVIITITAVILLPTLIIAATKPRSFWAALTIACCLLALGIIPIVWSLPIIEKVQFPWRILTIAEFTFVTLLIAPGRLAMRWRWLAAVPALALSLPIMTAGFYSGPPSLVDLDKRRPEVLEYLPAQARFQSIDEVLEFARRTPPRSEANGIVTLRRFHFPHWVVRCGGKRVQAFAERGTGLLSYVGGRDCTVEAGTTRSENAGMAISLVASLVLLSLTLVRRRRASAYP